MAYIINKFSGEQLIVLEDGTIDTSTSLGLVGRNYVGYGETQNENFVYLLENFANNDPPQRPLTGQIWFDTDSKLANIYDGANWNPIGVKLSDTEPVEPNAGSLWLDTTSEQLKIYTGAEWGLVGPEAVAGFGITRASSTVLFDVDNKPHPVIFFEINDTVIAISSSEAFVIDFAINALPGFASSVKPGITMAAGYNIEGNLIGIASRADGLSTARLINGVPFDALSDITIKASTSNKLIKGTYILGSDFDGGAPTTWSVDASSANQIGKIVARNSTGGFAAGTITADLVGNVTGNVTATSGTSRFDTVEATVFVGATLTGNANSATQLATPRQINGVTFSGTENITVPAAAATLTGNILNSTVTQSSLISLGTLNSLAVADAGISIGSAGTLKFLVESARPTLRSTSGTLNFDMGANGPDVSFVDATTALSLGGPNAPAIIGDNTTNLGINGYRFNNIYANNLVGNADTATLAVTATNLAGGGLGAIPYQTANGVTTMLGLGAAGTVLTAQAGGISWIPSSRESLTRGSFLTLVNSTTSGAIATYDGQIGATIAVDATSTNTASKVVVRDASGNFAAGTITANLTGNVTGSVSGNASTATSLQTARTINGVAFDGTGNITVTAIDSSKVAKVGDTMSGYLTLNGNPVSPLHATPKQYVDSRLPTFQIISGISYSIAGFTNQVGSWNFGANFFDVFPPAGKTMGNLIAFIPSIHVIHFAGGVNGDDSLVCTYSYLGDRIRVYVQNTEQRSTPAANYLVVWGG
jgi:hypothetical protein